MPLMILPWNKNTCVDSHKHQNVEQGQSSMRTGIILSQGRVETCTTNVEQ